MRDSFPANAFELRPSLMLGYVATTIPKFWGVHPRTCPICLFTGRFRAFGSPPRWDAQCPRCKSLERHRLFKLLVDSRPDLVRGRVIHFAAEPGLVPIFRSLADDYRTAALDKAADLTLNIEAIDLPDDSVDTLIASHILEHVNDLKALSEFHRCLRPSGNVLLAFPMVEAWQTTYENPSIVSPEGRAVHFGQWDHVRYYGSDVRDRIRSTGFELSEFFASPEECVRYGLQRGETVFTGTKRQ